MPRSVVESTEAQCADARKDGSQVYVVVDVGVGLVALECWAQFQSRLEAEEHSLIFSRVKFCKEDKVVMKYLVDLDAHSPSNSRDSSNGFSWMSNQDLCVAMQFRRFVSVDDDSGRGRSSRKGEEKAEEERREELWYFCIFFATRNVPELSSCLSCHMIDWTSQTQRAPAQRLLVRPFFLFDSSLV